MTAFDRACADFTDAMNRVATWRHVYPGISYQTRLWQAIHDAERAIAALKTNLDQNSLATVEIVPDALQAALDAAVHQAMAEAA